MPRFYDDYEYRPPWIARGCSNWRELDYWGKINNGLELRAFVKRQALRIPEVIAKNFSPTLKQEASTPSNPK
jgi:hypothetical protein